MNYLVNNPHGMRDSASLVAGVGLYGAVQTYRRMRDEFSRRTPSLYGRAVKGAILSLKKKNKMAPFGRTKRGAAYLMPYTPPRTPKRRRLNAPTVAQLKRRLRMSSTNRFKATIAALNRRNLGTYQRVSKNNKYLKKIRSAPTMAKNTGGGYAGTVGKTYKLKKTLEFKILQTGALKNIEYKGVSKTDLLLGNQTLNIGHANYTGEFLVQLFWMSVLKAFMIKVGYPILDFSESVPADLVGDVIVVRYKDSYLDGPAIQTSITIPANTWHFLATVNFRNTFVGKTNQFQLVSLELDPLETSPFKYTRMWCKNARVMLHSNSELTVQNRTPPAVESTDQDVVDNQPLKAVMYYGKGNGTQIKDVQGAAISEYVPGPDSGVIDVSPSAIGSNGQQEPPEPHYFAACKRTGAFYLDPGQTKSSSIRDTRTLTISTFFNMVFGVERTNSTKSLIKLGNHKFFSFEKIVDCVQSQPVINVGFEHNLRVAMVFKPGFNTYTNPYFESKYKPLPL